MYTNSLTKIPVKYVGHHKVEPKLETSSDSYIKKKINVIYYKSWANIVIE